MPAEADTPSSEGQQRRHHKNILKTDNKYKKQNYSSRRPKYNTRDRHELIRLGEEERRGGDGPVILRKGKDVTPLRLIYRKHLDLPRDPQLDKPEEQPADLNLAISDTTSIATNTLQEMMNRPPAQVRYTTEAVMEWTEKDAKNRDYTIELSETGTICLFHMPTEYVSELDEEKELHAKIKANNKRHAKVSLLSGDSDICSSAAVQTYNNLKQSQGTQTQKRENADVGIQVTSWQIHDERNGGSEFGYAVEADATRESAFIVVERAVIQNLAAPLQRMYRVQDVRENNAGSVRNEFDSEDERSDDGVEKGETKLRHLWCFATEELQNNKEGLRQSVTCLTQPGDLLCAGYGSTVFGNKNEGQIRLWTLKNMYHPERTYNLTKGVTSVNFSTIHPYLLAAGLYDGAVCIYDIRSCENKPVLRSNMGTAKHSSAVWEVIWGKNEVSHTSHEQLYSISSDGAVKQWTMKKGFISTDIMSLKRVPNQASQLGKKSSNTIRSRQASGMCFDFPKNDPT